MLETPMTYNRKPVMLFLFIIVYCIFVSCIKFLQVLIIPCDDGLLSRNRECEMWRKRRKCRKEVVLIKKIVVSLFYYGRCRCPRSAYLKYMMAYEGRCTCKNRLLQLSMKVNALFSRRNQFCSERKMSKSNITWFT